MRVVSLSQSCNMLFISGRRGLAEICRMKVWEGERNISPAGSFLRENLKQDVSAAVGRPACLTQEVKLLLQKAAF